MGSTGLLSLLLLSEGLTILATEPHRFLEFRIVLEHSKNPFPPRRRWLRWHFPNLLCQFSNLLLQPDDAVGECLLKLHEPSLNFRCCHLLQLSRSEPSSSCAAHQPKRPQPDCMIPDSMPDLFSQV